MDIRKHIPNTLTLLNLMCGCIAVHFASTGDHVNTLLFVCLGIFFDFFDGFFARLFNVAGPLGLQLDSLADMVTSGVVPGLVMFKMLSPEILQSSGLPTWLSFSGFLVTLGACYRLANFNIDTRQADSFIGLPTPANALFIASLPFVKYDGGLITFELMITPYVLFAIILLSAFIMNAEIPLFSLKVKKFSLANNKLQIFFLALSFALLVAFRVSGIPLVIFFYVLLSLINNNFGRKA